MPNILQKINAPTELPHAEIPNSQPNEYLRNGFIVPIFSGGACCGNGFFVGDLFFTSGHVVANSPEPYIEIDSKRIKLVKDIRLTCHRTDDNPDSYDIAIFKIVEMRSDLAFNYGEIGTDMCFESISFNEKSGGFTMPEYCTAKIIGDEYTNILGEDFQNSIYFGIETSKSLKEGCSGSPVFLNGKVIGILTGGNNKGDGTKCNEKLPLNFCYVLTAKAIKKLMENDRCNTLYIASDPSLAGSMKHLEMNNGRMLCFFPSTFYPLDACHLMKDGSKKELARVTRNHIPKDGDYSIPRFFDTIHSEWDEVYVWHSDNVADEILMMMVAKFAPKGKYPIYEIVLDSYMTNSHHETGYLKEMFGNLGRVAKRLSSKQIEVLSGKFDSLLKNDTGLRIRNKEGEITNVELDHFIETAYSVVDENAQNPRYGAIVLGLMGKGVSYNVAHKVLFGMKKRGLLQIRNEKTGKEVRYFSGLWTQNGGLNPNIVVVR